MSLEIKPAPDLRKQASRIEGVLASTTDVMDRAHWLVLYDVRQQLLNASCSHQRTERLDPKRAAGICNDCGANVRVSA
jgi:hypothetical protein